MRTIHAAIDARVSSAQPADAHTVASQGAALQERVATDGLTLPEGMPCLDAGSSGATVVRPALERWRDLVAAGAVDRLAVHAPDRLARQDASQVLLSDACQRLGVDVLGVHRASGRSPADDRLLQVQGRMAESARATMVARHRRGTWHAARSGAVQVLRGAPSGSRDVSKPAGGGHARSDMVAEAARVVRHVCAWMGGERLTIGEVGRRLTQAGDGTRTGTTVWDRRGVWGMLTHPASTGVAACGTTRQGPLRSRWRAPRRRPLHPRRAGSVVETPPEDWVVSPVPALGDPEVCAAVQEPWQAQKHHARQTQRGARALRHGWVPWQHGGEAWDGKPVSRKAAKGQPRA